MSFYKMERGWLDSEMFSDAPYSERDAWAWMIGEARFADGVIAVKGSPMALKRGQLYTSIRFMSVKFQWSKDRVSRYLERLKKWGAIGVETATGQNLITICNYSDYQDTKDAPKDTIEDSTKDAPKDKQEEILRNSKKEKNIPPKKAVVFEVPDWIELKSWEAFCEHRKKIRKPMSAKAQELTVKELDALRTRGHAPEEVLNQSIQRGWAGVFEIKKGNENASTIGNRTNGNSGVGNKSERARAAMLKSGIELGYVHPPEGRREGQEAAFNDPFAVL